MNHNYDWNVLTKTVADTGTPEVLASSSTIVNMMIVMGKSTAQGADNAATVYIGPSSTDGENPYPIAGGDIHFFTFPSNRPLDLSHWYADCGSNGEGVVILYQ